MGNHVAMMIPFYACPSSMDILADTSRNRIKIPPSTMAESFADHLERHQKVFADAGAHLIDSG